MNTVKLMEPSKNPAETGGAKRWSEDEEMQRMVESMRGVLLAKAQARGVSLEVILEEERAEEEQAYQELLKLTSREVIEWYMGLGIPLAEVLRNWPEEKAAGPQAEKAPERATPAREPLFEENWDRPDPLTIKSSPHLKGPLPPGFGLRKSR